MLTGGTISETDWSVRLAMKRILKEYSTIRENVGAEGLPPPRSQNRATNNGNNLKEFEKNPTECIPFDIILNHGRVSLPIAEESHKNLTRCYRASRGPGTDKENKIKLK